MMEIRRIESQEDQLAAARVDMIAFTSSGYGPEAPYCEEPSQGWGAFVGGQPVSCMVNIPYKAFLDGHSVGMGGIQAVCTLPEYRKSGMIRALFERVFEQMHEEGWPLSALYPFSFPYYRQFGYELAQRVHTLRWDHQAMRGFASFDSYKAEMIREDSDFEPFQKIYAKCHSGENLSVDRQEWIWRRLLKRYGDPSKLRYGYLLRDAKSRPAAYVLIWVSKVDQTTTLHIDELGFINAAALKATLGYLSRFADHNQAYEWRQPPHSRVELLFANPDHLGRSGMAPSAMARIVDAAEALRLMTHPEGSGNYVIGIEDSFLKYNNGRFKVSFETGQVVVAPTGKDPDISVTAARLSQLITGFADLRDMAGLGGVEVNSKRALLERVFVQKRIFLMDRF